MGMAGERQRDAVGHARKNIRLVHEQEDGIVGSDLRQRTRQVVFAAEAAMAEEMRELIANAGEPEPLALRSELDRVVFQDGDARIGERIAHAWRFRTTSRDCRGSPRRRAAP